MLYCIWKVNGIESAETAHYVPAYLDLYCLQIQVLSFSTEF